MSWQKEVQSVDKLSKGGPTKVASFSQRCATVVAPQAVPIGGPLRSNYSIDIFASAERRDTTGDMIDLVNRVLNKHSTLA